MPEETTQPEAQETTNESPTPDTSQGNTEGNDERTFTQADVDRLLGERAKRAKDSAQSTFLETLGVDDLESAKALLADAKKRQEAEMSEVEKALAQADKERKRADDLAAQLEATKQAQINQRRESAFKSALRNAGASNEDDLTILVHAKMGSELASAFNDDGSPIDNQLSALIKQVQSNYSTYFATAGAGNPSMAGGTPPTDKNVKDEEIRKQLKSTRGKW